MKPVCNDHLSNKIYYQWFIQWCVIMKTEGTNLLLLATSALWAPEGREVSHWVVVIDRFYCIFLSDWLHLYRGPTFLALSLNSISRWLYYFSLLPANDISIYYDQHLLNTSFGRGFTLNRLNHKKGPFSFYPVLQVFTVTLHLPCTYKFYFGSMCLQEATE